MASSEGRPERASMDDGKLKIAVLGHPGVGKTAILNRFLNHTFSGIYEESLGDIYTYAAEWDGKPLELDIIDVPGGEEFEDVRLRAIQQSEAFILVYSTDEGLSFKELNYVREVIFDEKEAGVPLVVVENKTDLPRSRWFKGAAIIPRILESAWASHHVKTSAKEEPDLSEIFKILVLEAQNGLRRPSRGSRTIHAYNALQEVLNIIEENNK